MKLKFNIPNKITIIRVGLIPLFIVILLVNIPNKKILAAFVFGMLSISDFFDGYIARKKKQITEFGKLIDPIADKLLISTALIFLLGKGVEFWIAATIISREVLITSIRIYLIPSKIVVPASNFGKAKTVVQSIAIVFALLQLPFSHYVLIGAVILTIVSGLEYLVRIREMTGNKLINLPNILTLVRFILIIPFIYYFLNSQIKVSLFIFAVISLSDKLDGISARLMNQKTELGSGIDSFTDWALIISTFVLLAIKNYINIWWFVSLVIPSLVSGIMKMIYAKRQKIVPSTFVAKLSVGLTYITIVLTLINIAYKVDFEYSSYLLIFTIAMIYLAMIQYIFKTLSIPGKSI